ncbi:MAG: DUF7467 domain-containing protein, partial [Gammaproteobacteria bacterium]
GDCDANGDTTVALGESKTCTLTNNDIPILICDPGKPKTLTFRYIGAAGDPFGNDQSSGDFFVNGTVDEAPVQITGVSGVPGNSLVIIGGASVPLNGTFTITGQGNKGIPPKVVFTITELAGSQDVQTVGIHTSCSQPLAVGDQFGSLIVVGL